MSYSAAAVGASTPPAIPAVIQVSDPNSVVIAQLSIADAQTLYTALAAAITAAGATP